MMENEKKSDLKSALARAEAAHKTLRVVLKLDPAPTQTQSAGRNPVEDIFSGFGGGPF